MQLITSRAPVYPIRTILDRDYAFDGFALSLPLPVVPRTIRSTLGRGLPVLARFNRDADLDVVFASRSMSIAHLTTTLFGTFLALDVGAVTALLQGPALALFPLFRRRLDGHVLDPQRLVELARPVPLRSLIEGGHDLSGIVAAFDQTLVRIDRLADDMSADQIPGRRRRAGTAPPLGVHVSHDDLLRMAETGAVRSPLYVDVDASTATPLKADVVQYLFALLSIVPCLRQMGMIRHVLDELKIPDPDRDLDLYRRAVQLQLSSLHDTAVRIPDKAQRLLMCSVPLGPDLSPDWIHAIDEDADRLETDFFSLSRMSLLGNAVLSFLIGSQLVMALPDATEGVLTQARAAILSQSFLVPVVGSLNLASAVLRPAESEAPGPKTLMALFSALFAVLYRCQGISACRRVLARVLFQHDPQDDGLRQYWCGVHPSDITKAMIADGHGVRWAGMDAVQVVTGGPWRCPELITAALTHRSAGGRHQERLEYLGDAVLQLLVTDKLMDLYPDAAEGQLCQLRTALVQNDNLVGVAERLHLQDCVARSSENSDPKLFADAVEALIGALYLDRDLAACRVFVSDTMMTVMEMKRAQGSRNVKSRLHERLSCGTHQNPVYIKCPESVSGQVQVQVYYDQKILATGRGRTTKLAERDAAQNALDRLDRAHR